MELSLEQYLILIGAAMLFGFSKAGIKGIAIFSVTIMALGFGSRASTGLVMPMLMVGDIFAITYYRKYVKWIHIYRLLPSIILGVLVGVFLGKEMDEVVFKQIMAIIIIVSVIIMYWWEYRNSMHIPESSLFGIIMGLVTGFTTMIGNLAGAFSNIYFLVMRLPKNEFIGTAAYLYFIVNLVKLPFHLFYWKTITLETLLVNLKVVPFQILALFIGVILVKKIKEAFYRKLILLLTAIGAIMILIN